MRSFLAVALLLTFISCASRKTSAEKLKLYEVKSAEIETSVDGTYIKNNNIFIDELINEIEYRPADTTKPMIINGKEYSNVVIKSKKINKKTIDTTKVKETVKLNKVEVAVETKEEETIKKDTDKKQNYIAYLWLLLLIPIIAVAYKILR